MTDEEYRLNYHNRKVNLRHTPYIYTIVGRVSTGLYKDCLVVRVNDIGSTCMFRLDQLDMVVNKKVDPLPLPG